MSRTYRVIGLSLLGLAVATSAALSQSVSPPRQTPAEARAKLDRALAGGVPSDSVALAWLGLARAFQLSGQPDSAGPAYATAARLGEQVADSAVQAEVTYAFGLHLLRTNQYDGALTRIRQARAIWTATGDSIGVWRTWNNTGAAHYQLGNYEQALNAFTEALRGRRREQDTVGIARVLTNIGKVYLDWGQHGRAETRLLEAVRLARAGKDPAVIGYALHTLSQVYVDTRRFDTAYRTIDASMASYRTVPWSSFGNDSTGGWRLNASLRGEARIREGRARDAIPVLDSVVALALQMNDIRVQAKSLMLLGDAYAALGDTPRARDLLTRSVALSTRVAQRVFTMQALERLSSLEERAGNATASLRALRAVTALRDTIFNRSTAERLAAEESREERERQELENSRLREAQRSQNLVIERQRAIVLLTSLVLVLSALLAGQLWRFNRLGRIREKALQQSNEELRAALADVRTLTGLIPICANCKSIRDDQGYWQAVESYITSHSDATFSHAICQNCGPKLYGDLWPATAGDAPEGAPGTG